MQVHKVETIQLSVPRLQLLTCNVDSEPWLTTPTVGTSPGTVWLPLTQSFFLHFSKCIAEKISNRHAF